MKVEVALQQRLCAEVNGKVYTGSKAAVAMDSAERSYATTMATMQKLKKRKTVHSLVPKNTYKRVTFP